MRRRPRWIDVTAPLGPGTRVYPGDPPVTVSIAEGAAGSPGTRVTSLSLSAHAGTHIDAPNHVRGGTGGVETWPLDAMIGPAIVMRAPARRPIDAPEMARLAPRTPPRLLFRGSPIITVEAGREMIRRGVLLVGTDGLSIDPLDDPELPAHRLLLRAGVVVLEGLELSRAPTGRYHLIVLPLLIPGADGAPARAVLRVPAMRRVSR